MKQQVNVVSYGASGYPSLMGHFLPRATPVQDLAVSPAVLRWLLEVKGFVTIEDVIRNIFFLYTNTGLGPRRTAELLDALRAKAASTEQLLAGSKVERESGDYLFTKSISAVECLVSRRNPTQDLDIAAQRVRRQLVPVEE
ncbi:MAG: hypothetical protein EBU46_16320 [Nitrosomonadaceae bacterium]|nr:hypothetical protein [Nitrosomonadaceae bacterium]